MCPSRTAELLDALGGEWAEGVIRLKEFEQLFGNTVRVALLNRVGGPLFADLQRILWDDLLLRITRLTDPPKTAGKDNLTIQRMPELLGSGDLPGKVQEQVDVAVHAAAFARSHRNQRISHRDLVYAIGDSELPSTSLSQIRRALDTVYAVLKIVNMALRNTHLSEVVSAGPRAEAFMLRADSLVDAVLCVEELLCESQEPKPSWHEDFARDCIRRLGATPSPDSVRRIVNLRSAARWLRADTTEGRREASE